MLPQLHRFFLRLFHFLSINLTQKFSSFPQTNFIFMKFSWHRKKYAWGRNKTSETELDSTRAKWNLKTCRGERITSHFPQTGWESASTMEIVDCRSNFSFIWLIFNDFLLSNRKTHNLQDKSITNLIHGAQNAFLYDDEVCFLEKNYFHYIPSHILVVFKPKTDTKLIKNRCLDVSLLLGVVSICYLPMHTHGSVRSVIKAVSVGFGERFKDIIEISAVLIKSSTLTIPAKSWQSKQKKFFFRANLIHLRRKQLMLIFFFFFISNCQREKQLCGKIN